MQIIIQKSCCSCKFINKASKQSVNTLFDLVSIQHLSTSEASTGAEASPNNIFRASSPQSRMMFLFQESGLVFQSIAPFFRAQLFFLAFVPNWIEQTDRQIHLQSRNIDKLFILRPGLFAPSFDRSNVSMIASLFIMSLLLN